MRRLLVLGGSWFLGSRLVSDALAAGWRVTAFHRGLSGSDVAGAEIVRGDRTDPADLTRLASHGPWDAVVDTSGYVPANVGLVARTLASVVGKYVFLSTVSVYRDWPSLPVAEGAELQECSADQETAAGSTGDPGPAQYGAFKAGCERAVIDAVGSASAVLLRPGVITGPGEYVGRLPWWLSRIARGGTVLAPGDGSQAIAPVDVRDVSEYVLLTTVDGAPAGPYNLAGSAESFHSFLDMCREVTRSRAAFEWVSDQRWLAERVDAWVELPLWHIRPAAWRVKDNHARANGYRTRPLSRTVADVWDWMNHGEAPVPHPRAGLVGLDAEKEARVLRDWHAHSAAG